jgi:hypothetical protein
MAKPTKRGRLASQNRGQSPRNRGQTPRRKRRQGGKGKPFEKGQPDLPGQRFQPGESGNPGGRPATLKEVQLLIQVQAIDLVNRAIAIAKGTPEQRGRELVIPSHDTQRLTIRDLLDRGFGRTVQAVEVSGPNGSAVETRDISHLNSRERRARLNELMAKAGAGVAVVHPRDEAAEDGKDEEDGPGAGEG